MTETTIIATFDNFERASEALKSVGDDEHGVEKGALVLRDGSGDLYYRLLNAAGFGDVFRSGLDLAGFLFWGGAAIAANVLISSAGLLLRSTEHAVNLAGSVVKLPVNMVRTNFLPDKRLRIVGDELAPGDSAVVVLVDAGRADEVRAELAAKGGRVAGPTEAAA